MDFKDVSNDLLDKEVFPATLFDEIKQDMENDILSNKIESIFLENNPNFFQEFNENFINQNEQWTSMLMDFAKELIHMKMPYYNDFQTYEFPSILISLIQTQNKQFLYLSLFIIAKLCKSSPYYAEALLIDSAQKYISHIITNRSQKMNFIIIAISLICLRNIAASSFENREKILLTLNIEKIGASVFSLYKNDNVIQAFFLFLNSLYSYDKISKEIFDNAYNLMTKITNYIGRKHIYWFLDALELLSQYSFSGILITKGSELLSFLEKSFTDLDPNIIKKVCKIIVNSLNNGGNICETIIASAITYLHCNNYDIIDCANEILLSLFIRFSKVEETIPLNLDIGILVRNTMEGTNESKHSSFDLLVFYLMKRNDKIEEALDNSFMDTIIEMLDSDKEEDQIKAVEMAKILLNYDQMTNFQRRLPILFEANDGLSRIHEILDETENEDLCQSIQTIINTYYDE